jgi:hypothetical protein
VAHTPCYSEHWWDALERNCECRYTSQGKGAFLAAKVEPGLLTALAATARGGFAQSARWVDALTAAASILEGLHSLHGGLSHATMLPSTSIALVKQAVAHGLSVDGVSTKHATQLHRMRQVLEGSLDGSSSSAQGNSRRKRGNEGKTQSWKGSAGSANVPACGNERNSGAAAGRVQAGGGARGKRQRLRSQEGQRGGVDGVVGKMKGAGDGLVFRVNGGRHIEQVPSKHSKSSAKSELVQL